LIYPSWKLHLLAPNLKSDRLVLILDNYKTDWNTDQLRLMSFVAENAGLNKECMICKSTSPLQTLNEKLASASFGDGINNSVDADCKWEIAQW
jgi:hypothetical protein